MLRTGLKTLERSSVSEGENSAQIEGLFNPRASNGEASAHFHACDIREAAEAFRSPRQLGAILPVARSLEPENHDMLDFATRRGRNGISWREQRREREKSAEK